MNKYYVRCSLCKDKADAIYSHGTSRTLSGARLLARVEIASDCGIEWVQVVCIKPHKKYPKMYYKEPKR